MLEKEMRRQLKYKMTLEMPHVLMQPIESGKTGLGIPDIYFKTMFHEGWIELKEIIITSADRIAIPFRPGQLPWIRRYIRLGGNIILLMTYKKSLYTMGWENLWIAVKGANIMSVYNSSKELDAAAYDIDYLNNIDLQKLFGKK